MSKSKNKKMKKGIKEEKKDAKYIERTAPNYFNKFF